jgi:hypothetical protein
MEQQGKLILPKKAPYLEFVDFSPKLLMTKERALQEELPFS